MKTKHPPRNRVVRLRLSDAELSYLSASARAAGLDTSRFLRGLLLTHKRDDLASILGNLECMPDAERPLLSRLIAEIRGSITQSRHPAPKVDPELVLMVARVGNVLNQIARHCHESRLAGTPADAARLFDSLEGARKELHRLAGISD